MQRRKRQIYGPHDDRPVHAMIESRLHEALIKLAQTAGYFNRDVIALFIYQGLRKAGAIAADVTFDLDAEHFQAAVERGRAIDEALDAEA